MSDGVEDSSASKTSAERLLEAVRNLNREAEGTAEQLNSQLAMFSDIGEKLSELCREACKRAKKAEESLAQARAEFQSTTAKENEEASSN